MKAFNLIAVAALILGPASILAAPAPVAGSWDDWDVIPGRLIVKYKADKTARVKTNGQNDRAPEVAHKHLETELEERFHREAAGRGQVDAKYEILLPRHFVGTFDHGKRAQVLQALADDPEVEYVEPDRKRVRSAMWATATPNDPETNRLWGMTRIGARFAWERQPSTRAPIRVAVMEGQFNTWHRDLSAQLSPVQNNSGASGNHATHVAGTIAAAGNNSLDVVGVANVELVSLATGEYASGFAAQIAWARNNGVRVINMSWKWCGWDGMADPCSRCIYPAASQTEQDAINAASDRIVFVAAACNDACATDAGGRSPIPVSYQNVVGVSALAQGDTRANFSNFGGYVDITAPGVNIRSTGATVTTYDNSGTSMASPHVAGSAAAVLAVRNNYDVPSIPRLLTLSAEDIGPAGRDNDFGSGVVRVDRAVAGIADVYAEVYPIQPNSRIGTLARPLYLNEALNNVPNWGTLGLVRGASEVFTSPVETLVKPCTITSVGGPVHIVR